MPSYGACLLYQDCRVERSETSRIAQLNVPRGHGLERDLGAKKRTEIVAVSAPIHSEVHENRAGIVWQLLTHVRKRRQQRSN